MLLQNDFSLLNVVMSSVKEANCLTDMDAMAILSFPPLALDFGTSFLLTTSGFCYELTSGFWYEFSFDNFNFSVEFIKKHYYGCL